MPAKQEIPLLELKGSPRQRGHIHGEALRSLIAEFLSTSYEVHRANMPMVASREALVDFSRRNLGFLKRYSPDLLDEMEGIAEGAGQTFDDILFLNSFLEMEDLRAPSVGGRILDGNLWGCTTFNVLPAASGDGNSYIGQTFDMELYYTKFNCMFRIHSDDGPTALVYSLAGILGLNGMNSAGIGMVINKLVATDAREGVIYPFIIRKSLAQTRIGDAFGATVFAERASGMNYQLASTDGVAFCIETSATWYDLLPFEDAIAHTNHYLSPLMRRYETPKWLSHGGSYVRHQVMSRNLKRECGHLTPATLKALTQDHTNSPRSVCAHGFDGQDEYNAFGSISACVMDLTGQTLWFSNGNPCCHDYVPYSI
ncbi:MAG: hypothetical protein H6Q76_918 [Firmicutes bacterium]|nr:hypothetical protein [Bacillota bacterium]